MKKISLDKEFEGVECGIRETSEKVTGVLVCRGGVRYGETEID